MSSPRPIDFEHASVAPRSEKAGGLPLWVSGAFDQYLAGISKSYAIALSTHSMQWRFANFDCLGLWIVIVHSH